MVSAVSVGAGNVGSYTVLYQPEIVLIKANRSHRNQPSNS